MGIMKNLVLAKKPSQKLRTETGENETDSEQPGRRVDVYFKPKIG